MSLRAADALIGHLDELKAALKDHPKHVLTSKEYSDRVDEICVTCNVVVLSIPLPPDETFDAWEALVRAWRIMPEREKQMWRARWTRHRRAPKLNQS